MTTIAAGFADTPEGHAAVRAAYAFAARAGDPTRTLLELSSEVDLLVCGSRGYGPLRGVVFGSVSRRLLDAARCPVLVVPRGVERPLSALVE